jgi:hypothetical protein
MARATLGEAKAATSITLEVIQSAESGSTFRGAQLSISMQVSEGRLRIVR